MTPVEIIHDDFNINVSKSVIAHSLWLVIWKLEKSALAFVKRQKIKKTKKKKTKNRIITAVPHSRLWIWLNVVLVMISDIIKNWFICILRKSDIFGNNEILVSDCINSSTFEFQVLILGIALMISKSVTWHLTLVISSRYETWNFIFWYAILNPSSWISNIHVYNIRNIMISFKNMMLSRSQTESTDILSLHILISHNRCAISNNGFRNTNIKIIISDFHRWHSILWKILYFKVRKHL